MKHARRWKLSAAQRTDMWNRWKAGQSLHEIGRVLGKEHHVIHVLLARYGGIAPPARRRSRRVLTLAEREDLPVQLVDATPPVSQKFFLNRRFCV
jgi:hypothetical protein